MSDMKRMVEVIMTEDEFTTMETGLATLICTIEGDEENAKIGAALLMMTHGPDPLHTLLGKVIALHEASFPKRNVS
jgi:hypothetical protein